MPVTVPWSRWPIFVAHAASTGTKPAWKLIPKALRRWADPTIGQASSRTAQKEDGTCEGRRSTSVNLNTGMVDGGARSRLNE
jgi:hypothetical protein